MEDVATMSKIINSLEIAILEKKKTQITILQYFNTSNIKLNSTPSTVL